jgi:hypothetical protein
MFLLGRPIKALKPFGALGSKPGSSIASYALSKAFPQSFTKTFGKKVGQKMAKSLGTNVIGRAAGRAVPYVGVLWTAADVGWYMGKYYGPSTWFKTNEEESLVLEYMRDKNLFNEDK